jgi:hypothetical protein
MADYFEDFWLGMQSELKDFDNINSNDFLSHEPSSDSNIDAQQPENTVNLEPQTYEALLNDISAPNPNRERLRSTDRSERIQAIRELYNKEPTILNAKLRHIATNLYKKGYTIQGNQLNILVDSLKK